MGPPPPGWKPGDIPPADPFGNAKNDTDRRHRFNQAVIDTLVNVGRPGRSHFGPRKNEFLPYLLIRAAAGDHGNRPLSIPFWESPDIFVSPNQEAATARALPETRGGIAHAGRPNTLWAHVWNLGLAPGTNVRVEFYWFNPSLGFNQASANLIGVAHVDLGNRHSARSHTLVKCPNTWVPSLESGGHQCLMVRCFEPLTDPLGPQPWNAADDRHVGQRNISVVEASSPATLQLPIRLGCGIPPGRVRVEVRTESVQNVEWLSILSGKRAHGLRDPERVTERVGLLQPVTVQSQGLPPDLTGINDTLAEQFLRRSYDVTRGCDELMTNLYVNVDGLQPGECRVYRIVQLAEGRLVGGYTVVTHRS